MPRQTFAYRRDELFDLVWREPLRTAAARYGISDVALGKICRKLRVPMPGRGYWNRIAAGRKLPRPTLKPLPAGVPDSMSVERWVPTAEDQEIQAILDDEKATAAPIVVPDHVQDRHPLLARAGVVDKRGTGLVIAVSEAQLDRAVRILDTLLRALEARGYTPAVNDKGLTTCVDGTWLPFGISERTAVETLPQEQWTPAQRRMPVYLRGSPPSRRMFTGELELALTRRCHHLRRSVWRDGKTRKVERHLNSFVAEMRARAASIQQRERAVEARKREWAAEEARRKEEADRALAEKQAVDRLRLQVDQWRFANDVRRFVSESRDIVTNADVDIDPEGSFGRWVQWATAYANQIDPLTKVRAEVARVCRDHAATDQAGE